MEWLLGSSRAGGPLKASEKSIRVDSSVTAAFSAESLGASVPMSASIMGVVVVIVVGVGEGEKSRSSRSAYTLGFRVGVTGVFEVNSRSIKRAGGRSGAIGAAEGLEVEEEEEEEEEDDEGRAGEEAEAGAGAGAEASMAEGESDGFCA